jgi:hypothetical protein
MGEAVQSIGTAIQSFMTPAGSGAQKASMLQQGVEARAQQQQQLQQAREQQAVAAAKQREEAAKRDNEAEGQGAAAKNVRGRRLLQIAEGFAGGGAGVPTKGTLG